MNYPIIPTLYRRAAKYRKFRTEIVKNCEEIIYSEVDGNGSIRVLLISIEFKIIFSGSLLFGLNIMDVKEVISPFWYDLHIPAILE
jgi:hypothetical protein